MRKLTWIEYECGSLVRRMVYEGIDNRNLASCHEKLYLDGGANMVGLFNLWSSILRYTEE